MKNNISKIKHLNLALNAIRNVNRLLVKEKDQNSLIQGVCETLIKSRGYYNVWIILLDQSGAFDTHAESGLGEDFAAIIEQFQKGESIDCVQKALKQPNTIFTENPSSDCVDCPLSSKYSGWGALAVRLEYAGKLYGVLSASIPKQFVDDEMEQSLVKEIAEDIAFGLYTIELEEKHKKDSNALKERIKELNYVFEFSNLIEKPDISLEEILQGGVELIPSAMRYPETTCARLTVEDQEFRSKNYQDTPMKLSFDLIVYGETVGVLEVCCLEKKSNFNNGPFLKEEKDLLNSVVERMGKVIERKRNQKALWESEQRFRDLVDNSVTGISIVQNDEIVYQNPAQEKLIGPLPRPVIFKADEEIHPDDKQKVKAFYEKIIAGKSNTADIDFRFYPSEKNGNKQEMRWVYCRTSMIEYQGKESILFNIVDMTKAKELEYLLNIQDKMTSLGRVAAGIAHEIRNPLSGFNIYLKTLEKIYTKNDSLEKVQKILKQLQTASNKIESVIRKVMDFSKPSEPKFVFTDINQPIKDAVELSATTLRKSGILFEYSYADHLQKCNIDPQMIEQVILNLITNAAEAMKNSDKEKRLAISSYLEDNYVCICVNDSGPGVPKVSKDKIFDPFYTTKGNSSGIGLSISHRIIMDHGGSLDVYTSKWGGAGFKIKLPVNEGTL